MKGTSTHESRPRTYLAADDADGKETESQVEHSPELNSVPHGETLEQQSDAETAERKDIHAGPVVQSKVGIEEPHEGRQQEHVTSNAKNKIALTKRLRSGVMLNQTERTDGETRREVTPQDVRSGS